MRLPRILSIPPLWIYIFWLASLASRIFQHGYVYGLNYNLFQPDGALYHSLTLRILGSQWHEASIQVDTFFQNMVGTTYLDGQISYSAQKIVLGRPLYSILSAPFVAVLGQNAMLIIPAFSFLALGLLLVKFAANKNEKYFVVAVYALFSFSTSVNRWFFSDITDGLFVFCFSYLIFVIVKEKSNVALVFATILCLISRPSGPILAPLFILLLIQSKKIVFLALTGFAAGITILTTLLSPEAAGVGNGSSLSFSERLQNFPMNFIRVIVVELGQLFVMDRILFALLLIAILFSFIYIKQNSGQLFLATLIAVFVYGGWNGSLGVNFRYQLPVLVPMAVLFLDAYREKFSKYRKIFGGLHS